MATETGIDLDEVLSWPMDKLKWYELFYFGDEKPKLAKASELVG